MATESFSTERLTRCLCSFLCFLRGCFRLSVKSTCLCRQRTRRILDFSRIEKFQTSLELQLLHCKIAHRKQIEFQIDSRISTEFMKKNKKTKQNKTSHLREFFFYFSSLYTARKCEYGFKAWPHQRGNAPAILHCSVLSF